MKNLFTNIICYATIRTDETKISPMIARKTEVK